MNKKITPKEEPMKTVEAIEKEISALKDKLDTVSGTTTEVYTRIVGYYRSVKNWNKGKREEYKFRTEYTQPEISIQSIKKRTHAAIKTILPVIREKAASYTYFFSKSCPNCPPVAGSLKSLEIGGRSIDVKTENGMALALEKDILSTPTVLFYDSEGKELFRAHSAADINTLHPSSVNC